MPSGRYAVSLDAALDPTFSDLAEVEERALRTSDFADALSVLFGVSLQ
jgi:hypothetical protein